MTDEQKRSEHDPPQGHYTMRLVSAKLQVTLEDDKPYLQVAFWITEATDLAWQDREWRKRMYLTPKAEQHSKRDLIRMGASQRALDNPELLMREKLVFECDVVYSGKWANLKNITTRVELHPVPPTGPVEPDPVVEPEPGTPAFYDY
jgi:hypothetical protein